MMKKRISLLTAAVLAGALMLSSLGLSGCGASQSGQGSAPAESESASESSEEASQPASAAPAESAADSVLSGPFNASQLAGRAERYAVHGGRAVPRRKLPEQALRAHLLPLSSMHQRDQIDSQFPINSEFPINSAFLRSWTFLSQSRLGSLGSFGSLAYRRLRRLQGERSAGAARVDSAAALEADANPAPALSRQIEPVAPLLPPAPFLLPLAFLCFQQTHQASTKLAFSSTIARSSPTVFYASRRRLSPTSLSLLALMKHRRVEHCSFSVSIIPRRSSIRVRQLTTTLLYRSTSFRRLSMLCRIARKLCSGASLFPSSELVVFSTSLVPSSSNIASDGSTVSTVSTISAGLVSHWHHSPRGAGSLKWSSQVGEMGTVTEKDSGLDDSTFRISRNSPELALLYETLSGLFENRGDSTSRGEDRRCEKKLFFSVSWR